MAKSTVLGIEALDRDIAHWQIRGIGRSGQLRMILRWWASR
jgi:hypothetical protein